jgi:hypothetical protein
LRQGVAAEVHQRVRLWNAGAVGVLVSWSLGCLIFRLAGTAMPTTFNDVGATHLAASLFSVTPQLFLKPMRWCTPDRQAAWLAISRNPSYRYRGRGRWAVSP